MTASSSPSNDWRCKRSNALTGRFQQSVGRHMRHPPMSVHWLLLQSTPVEFLSQPPVLLLHLRCPNLWGFRDLDLSVMDPSCAAVLMAVSVVSSAWKVPHHFGTSGASFFSITRTQSPGCMLWTAKSKGSISANWDFYQRDFTRESILATHCLKYTPLPPSSPSPLAPQCWELKG